MFIYNINNIINIDFIYGQQISFAIKGHKKINIIELQLLQGFVDAKRLMERIQQMIAERRGYVP